MNEKKLVRQREHRALTNNAATKKYEKTKNGKLMRCYRNMQSRIFGIQKLKYHLYKDREIMSREDFYEFSINDKQFNELYDAWVNAEYNRKLCPSIDRIDSSKGYTMDNVRWITHSENSRLGAMSRYKKD